LVIDVLRDTKWWLMGCSHPHASFFAFAAAAARPAGFIYQPADNTAWPVWVLLRTPAAEVPDATADKLPVVCLVNRHRCPAYEIIFSQFVVRDHDMNLTGMTLPAGGGMPLVVVHLGSVEEALL
jgi:hypothetical protein